ncbi:hypothetical protein QN277_019688 [Acacia crassicarpa]|uniref:Uncharacterized protein n=1 Tax=Acacia crassicarpa TaxID=499986 RepID=A0AAE1MMH0_9FABA|nr:hypothetical protein QN277_019688 [Acacia crassicarpa]
MNRAFGAKLSWNLVIGSKSLWANVLQYKYMIRSDEDLLNVQPGESKVLRFICQQKDIVQSGTKMADKGGGSVSFIKDCWLFKDARIMDKGLMSLSIEEASSSVADWGQNGTWNYSRLADVVVTDVIRELMASIPASHAAGNDIITWGANSHGMFTVKSSYFLIVKTNHG